MRTLRAVGAVASLFVSATFASIALAGPQQAGPAANATWLDLDQVPAGQEAARAFIRPEKGRMVAMSPQLMREMLAAVPLENTARAAAEPVILTLPSPDGGFQRFKTVESPVMEPALAAKFPGIKTYSAIGIDDPAATARFDISQLGFRAQVRSPNGTWYIDPYSVGNDILHTSYYRKDYGKPREAFRCLTPDGGVDALDISRERLQLRSQAARIGAGTDLRTYRIAVCTTREYTAFFGDTVVDGLAAVVSVINRITGIYEVDFAARLVLVANNNLLIFTSTTTPYPFTNTSNASTTNTQAHTHITNTIGTANFDTGHTFHRGSDNGLAGGIGTVCNAPNKGQGYTSTNPPTGDLFAVDYAAHEVGHNFGGRHCFGNCGGGAGDAGALAVEPGSGSTIMAYTGICGAQNLQANSDPYFNGINVQQVLTFLNSVGCASLSTLNNAIPTVSAGANYTIPSHTPFLLTATANDLDGDTLTYCWEQQDGRDGAGIPLSGGQTTGPLTRSISPTTSPLRSIPRISQLVLGAENTTQEVVPTVARTMNWKVTVRDGRGGVNDSNMAITVVAAGPGFSVTYPNIGAGTLLGNANVTWNVAGTNGGSVNCPTVRILLSTDGGLTYPTVLNAGTPNDGSEIVLLPNITTSTARIRVEAVGNIFFDISNQNFSIIPAEPGVAFASGGAGSISDTAGNGNANTYADPGESAIHVTLPVLNNGQTTATGVSGTLTSLTPTVSIVSANAAYPDLAFGATGNNTAPFVIAISPSHPCGTGFSLRLDVNSNEGSGQIDYTAFTTGSPGGVGPAQTFSYTGAALAIPDNNATGVTAVLPISGVSGAIGDVDFRFDGSSCNTTATSTTVGLNHDWIGDLIVTLTSPGGTSVVLVNRIGVNAGSTFGSSGHNFCQTLFDDDGAFPNIQSAVTANAPHTGTWLPANGLSSFDGGNPNGNWSVKVVDAASSDTGSLRTFSIIIRTTNPPVCTPPLTVTGACCVASNRGVQPPLDCQMLTEDDCNLASGSYLGDGVPCLPETCASVYACCFSDGSCTELSTTDCDLAGGTPDLGSLVCSPNPCPEPTGACCAPDGNCSMTTLAGCAPGSLFLGIPSSCTINACAGACCAGGINCSLQPNAPACSGFFAGPGSACNVHPEHVTPCCHADFNGSGMVTVQDLFDFLAAYFAQSGSANFNGQGGVTVQDLFDFLSAWFLKCN